MTVVSHLASLFWQLEYCETAAVTPALELAKLALVTSRDEEEDDADKGGTDTSNDTDATLVGDGPSRFPLSDPPNSANSSSLSILGKRSRNGSQQGDPMEVDSPVAASSPDADGFTMISLRAHEDAAAAQEQAGSSNQVPVTSQDADGDAVMGEGSDESPSQLPPLPPRKPEPSNSVMMFGKRTLLLDRSGAKYFETGRQHDVSECMDNCMFQIETALLKFDELSGSQSSKTSVVKRCVFFRLRHSMSSRPQKALLRQATTAHIGAGRRSLITAFFA